MNSKEVGDFGEKIAFQYLENKGYQILDKNYSPSAKIAGRGPKRGEIDIIARKDSAITFVEVKTLNQIQRGSIPVFLPETKVDYFKKRKIIKTAQQWLMEKRFPLDSKWQIDVIAVEKNFNNQKIKLRHWKNVLF